MKSEIIRVGQIEVKFLLEAADTNGSVAMFEFTVPVGAKMPLPHSHKHYDDVKALAIITPALLGPDFFRQAAAIVNAGGPPDVEKLKAVMLKHGLVPAMPPVVAR